MKQILHKIIVLYVFLCFDISYSQIETRGKATYTRTLAFSDKEVSTDKFDLFFKSNLSLFIKNDNIQKSAEALNYVSENDQEIELNVKVSSSKPYAVHTDLIKNKILSRMALRMENSNETVIVEESIFKIKWKIEEEIKQIGQFNCQKATGSFRGRHYNAWFTPEISVNLGPWKFNGLPGLILEIYDDTKQVYFGLESVVLSTDISDKNLYLEKKGLKTISLRESVDLTEDQVQDVVNTIISKLPRGSSLDYSTFTVDAIETEFEWEVEKTEN